MTVNYSKDQQQQLCELWRTSNGITLKQFCQENKVSKSSMYKWLASCGKKALNCSATRLLPIQAETSLDIKGLEILLPNGILVRGDNAAIINLITELLR